VKHLTANRLADGAVVWRTASGAWSTDFGQAAAFEPDVAEAALAAAVAQVTVVVGAYLIDTGADGAVVPRERLRETIRAGGPSVGHSLDKAA
jgi:uncharacterized protein DUF2849